MAKLVLTAATTFKTNVLIPVPGKKPTPVEFIFKGRTKTEFKAFTESLRDMEDVDAILAIATGWELADDFGREAIEQLCEAYIGAARAVIETYLNELSAARLGN
jgi:hypothetical protein